MNQEGTLLQAIQSLPAGAQVTLTVGKEDLVAALQERDENPDRLVTTVWLSERLGMSRTWWARNAERVPGARQESEGSPWYLPLGAAKRFFEEYWTERKTPSRSRRRGPRQPRRSA